MKLISESLLEITIDFLKEVRENSGACLVGLIDDLENVMQTPSAVGDDKPEEIRRRRLSDSVD
ncbi:MAG: hypothetical protein NTY50_17645 [Methylobacter sp.]|nr:hypothetical protein [Methylobacter sp.]